MASIPQDLVGREVYARDGGKVGEIRELVYDGEYCLIRRSWLSKLIVPVRAIDSSGERLVIPHTSAYLDNAPKIDPKYALTPQDKGRLDRFYMERAA